ncbi:tRNA pseudouridine(55) synthase TruB [Microbacterium sp. STN6]|uniref:tRNA pseudouridine(55) synthase TruB n=1 Tax=Microbacterium sp. STN6 TaxID=2995588 RepID=UPI0022609767|nr:tRNA pseudouridine(55) synthase TruB [Microbacterium sp. STN6]MCX7521222.1 tRNA pseudouridine(55) synthase TruB [Microbacterium sp. STN6]
MVERRPGPTGILLIDKPQGLTSHDVVAHTRKAAGTRKVGHAGTLDPMATGLLILGLGSATRLLTYVVGVDKEYLATIRLGISTSTDDAEGTPVASAPAGATRGIGEAEVRAGIAALTGEIDQVPSTVSAIKVGGKRAYALARAGEQVELKARRVTVSAFEVLGMRRAIAEAGADAEADAGDGAEAGAEADAGDGAEADAGMDDGGAETGRDPGAAGAASGPAVIDVDVRVECSSGTYVRALARDLGAALGVGGHLTALRRTRVGPFHVSDAALLADLDVDSRLRTPADAASALFDVFRLSPQQAVDLGHGKRIRSGDERTSTAPVAAIADGRLVGLVDFRGGEGRSLVNFPTDEQ